ncbi:cell wall-binding repeat-containing protein [Kineococcus sp. SYSU DK018]|uniref:cell wall-binding repeat-containing protein n=1 Tax=Kineococcus sp. SYSU DK018 TaxID=3383139 RepID=UPI003D7CCFE9
MTAATSRLRRRGIGAGVAALVGLTGVGLTAAPAFAAPSFEITRPAQTGDRFETAASVALAAFPNGAENVIIANGDNAVDALAASVLAGTDIPILYVTTNEIPAATQAALTQLDPSASWIVGGTAAVSATVEGDLPGAIERLDGATRYATAASIAQAVVDNATQAPTTAFLARGDDFADALAIAPAAAKSGTPVLLTETGSLNPAAADFLADNGITNVTVLGGTAAVSEAVVDQLEAAGVTVQRIRGANRQATAVAVAQDPDFAFSNTGVALVNGWRPVDALPASVWAAQQNFPIILTAGDVLGAEAQGYLTANEATLVTGFAVGGTGVIPNTVVEAAEQAGGNPPGDPAPTTNQSYAVTLAGDSVINLGGSVESRTRTYTATVPAGTVVDIQLFEAANVTTTDGQTLIATTGANTTADPGATTGATITSVNGVPGASADGITSNGTVTFTVTGTDVVSVAPVVFADAADDDAIALTAPATANEDPKAPTDAFGVGPAVSFVPAQAALGSSAPTVDVANVAGGFFTSTAGSTGGTAYTYVFDANDTFQYQGVGITFAQFQSLLSTTDVLSVAYNPNGLSTFNLTADAGSDAPGAPTAAAANVDSGATVNDVRVTYTRPAGNASGVTYSLERSSDAGTTWVAASGATQAAGSGTGVWVFTDTNLADATYVYRVVATNPVTGTVDRSSASGSVTIPGTIESDQPLSLSSRVVTNAGFTGDADAGDVFRIIFNEDMTVTSGAALRFTDNVSNDAYQFTNGVNATFALNPASVTFTGSDAGTYSANRVLTVTVTGNPAPIAGTEATDLPASYPLTVTAAAGIADVAGNTWDIAGSVVAPGAGTNEVQTVTTGSATSGTINLTFAGQTASGIAYNADAATVDAALEGLSNIGAGDVTVTGTDLTTGLTVTFTGALAGTDVAQLTSDDTNLVGGTTTIVTTTQGAAGSPGGAGGTVIQP